MKKTKIVTSIGPSSYDPDVFEKMVLVGLRSDLVLIQVFKKLI